MTHRPRVYMLDLLATVPYYTAYLSQALIKRGVQVRVGSITYYLDLECFRCRGLSLHPGCMDIVGRFPRLPRRLRQASKLAETLLNLLALRARFFLRPPEILHVQFLPLFRSRLPLDFWLVQWLRRRGVRVVLTVHDLLPHDTADRFREKFVGLYDSADALICHSDHIRSRLIVEFGVPAQKIHVIPHGPFFYDLPAATGADTTSVHQRYGIAAGQNLVLWQGIIFPYKGLDLLLDAWANVEKTETDATLIVAGTGSAEMTDAVRRQVERLGLRHVVLDLRFASTEELVTLYRAAAVVVYPYRAISTSGALATGLALGKAIVASDLPVFKELLTDGEDALLVPPGDRTLLADSIVRLLHQPALRQQLADAVKRKDFGVRSWQTIAQQTEAVYAALCS